MTTPAKPDQNDAAQGTLELFHAMKELFDGADADLPLKSLPGKVVQFKAAKMKHLDKITVLIGEMAASLSEAELGTVVNRVSALQEKAISEGVSPYDLNTTGLVNETLGNASLVAKLATAGLQSLPKFVCYFTNLEPDEFGELEADEGLLIALGVFARNYSFFTQRVPPVIAAFVAAQRAKKK